MSRKINKEFLRTIKYFCVAASAGAIQFGTFALFNELCHFPYWVSYLVSLILSILWNFTLNRKYTFKSASNVPKAMLLVFAYYLVFTPLSTFLEDYLTETCHWNEYLVTIINMLLNGVTEFLFQRFVVFRGTVDTNQSAKAEAAREKAAREESSDEAESTDESNKE